jgi:D-arabinose 1-dehydrogenase-like Zn-dependent alcohol dehydrogenase
VVGLYGGAIQLPTPYLPMRALTLRGSYVGSHADMAELLALVNDKGVPSVPVSVRTLDDVSQALADLRAGKVVGRVVLAG